MKTYQPKAGEVTRTWHTLDAKDQVLGRFATNVSTLLMGKQKPSYSAHMDSGDFVVVINAEKIILTGNKEKQKLYRSHSGYPGGFRELSIEKIRKEFPERIIEHAVSGMLPDNRLKRDRMKRLKVVVGDKNPYSDKI